MTKAQLLEQRGDKLKAADALLTAAQNESRSMTSEEVTQFDALEAEAKAIGETVARMERTAGRQNVRQVSINQEGEIFFHSRTEDMINLGGVTIYTKDIEEMALLNKDITEAIVIKKESDIYEELAILVVETNLDSKEIRTDLKNKLSQSQMPNKIYTFEKLPRFSLDKLDRQKIKQMIGEIK